MRGWGTGRAVVSFPSGCRFWNRIPIASRESLFASSEEVRSDMGLVGAAGPSAMAKLKGAMAKLSATPGDPKTDVLVVIASCLIMNDGNGITRETPTKSAPRSNEVFPPPRLTRPSPIVSQPRT